MNRTAAVPFWRDVRVLTALSQVAFVVAMVALITFLYNNLSTAMSQRGLVAGFGFLQLESGFDIGEGLIDYRPSDTYGRAFMVGLFNTVLVSILGIVLSTILGVIVGVSRLSSNWIVNRLAAAFVEIIRNTPLLVQLFFIYFGIFVKLPPVRDAVELGGGIYASQRGIFLPKPVAGETFGAWALIALLALLAAAGVWLVLSRWERTRCTFVPALSAVTTVVALWVIAWVVAGAAPLTLELPEKGRFNFSGGLAMSPEFSAILFGLVIYTAGFIAEVVRGGIQAVRYGQIEAARALGLDEWRILQKVTFPQAMRVIVPPLTSQYLNLAKNSSLAIAVGYPDVFAVSSTIANQTGQPVPVIALVMAIYLTMSLVTSLIMNVYNRRVQVLEK